MMGCPPGQFVMRLATLPFPLRFAVFLLTLVLLWLPFAAVLYFAIADANLLTILSMSLLFGWFLLGLRLWGRRVRGADKPFEFYGLVWSWQGAQELLEGGAIALLALAALFLTQSVLGWLVWQTPSPQFPRFVLEGLLVGLGVGFAEELFFRGWLLEELQQDYRRPVALWANSLIFAGLHFIRPLEEILRLSPQFFGYALLGLTAVWAKRATGRLGLPVGIHAGLVGGYYVLNLGDWVRYTQRVPEWVTGIHQNPLAGVMGLLFLSGLAFYTWKRQRTVSKISRTL